MHQAHNPKSEDSDRFANESARVPPVLGLAASLFVGQGCAKQPVTPTLTHLSQVVGRAGWGKTQFLHELEPPEGGDFVLRSCPVSNIITTDRVGGDFMATDIALDKLIEITSGVSGGKPRIAGRRITVQNIAIWHERMGLSADQIAMDYDLTLAEIYAALAYYFEHRAEIDQSIHDGQALADAVRQAAPSQVKAKLHGG